MSIEPNPTPESPLESWKEIAAYLNRDARTVRRWEKAEGLPVHRHQHLARSSVYAFRTELDAWRMTRKPESSLQAPLATWPARFHWGAATVALGIAMVSLGGGRVTGSGLLPRQVPVMNSRLVWSGDVGGTITRDARHVAYVDWSSTKLGLRDLFTGTDRQLMIEGGAGGRPVVSDDGTLVAYQWFNSRLQRYELRQISTAGTGLPASRMVFGGVDVQSVLPLDWSPDNNWIAVKVVRTNARVEIGLVHSADGSLRVLKPLSGRGPTQLLFSPDGRHLAYSLPAQDGRAQSDIFTIASDGSSETVRVRHAADDRLIGWSPDGMQLLFTSDRSGSIDLFATPFSATASPGAPKLVKSNIGDVVPVGMTVDGALFFETTISERDIEVATIDLESGRALSPPARPVERHVGTSSDPAWSLDGRWLAYKSSRRHETNGQVLVIREVDSGRERELSVNLRNFRYLSWAPNGSALAAGGVDLTGRRGVFQIDVASGLVTPVVVPGAEALSMLMSFPQWSPDATHLYYTDANGAIQARDLASGRDRELFRSSPGAPMHLSPDGRWIAVRGTSANVTLVSLAGEPLRQLPAVAPTPTLSAHMAWTPDSRAVVVRNMVAGAAGGELWLVPLTGTSRRLDVDVSRMATGSDGAFRLHPDGRRLAFLSGRRGTEIWVLENFLRP